MSVFSMGTLGALTGNTPQDMRMIRGYMVQMNDVLSYVLGNIGEENLTQEVRQNIYQGSVSGKVGAEELDMVVKALEGQIEALGDALGQQMTELEGQIAAQAETITSLEERIASLEARVTALEEGA